MSIPPDTKDWTWVLDRSCSECGFDAATVTPDNLTQRIEAAAEAIVDRLGSTDATERPDETTWSALEYAAHVADVCHTMLNRLKLMLSQESPTFSDWDQDAAAEQGRYHEQPPDAVAIQLRAGAAEFAGALRAVPVDAWDRPGTRSGGSEFTVWTLAVYALHDLEHHVVDVRKRA